MIAPGQQPLDVSGGRHAGLGSLGTHPVRRSVRHRAVRRRHVRTQRRPVILPGQSDMAGRPLAAMEDLHGRRRDEHIDALADQRIRHGIEVRSDGHVIVDVDRRPDRPLADHVGLNRQKFKGGAFDRFEQRPPAAFARRRHRLVVQLGQQQCDRLLQLGQREKLAMTQRCKQPATGLQHGVLDPRLGDSRQLQAV